MPTVAATLDTTTASDTLGTDTLVWNATLTWSVPGDVGNGKRLHIAIVIGDGSTPIEVRDNERWDSLGADWISEPGTVGVLIDQDTARTVADLEAAINASSSLCQVTTPDLGGGEIGEFDDDVAFDGTFSGGANATAEGTTIDVLNAGSLDYCVVVAIEGYGHLVTNHHDRDAVVDAWVGTDWEGTEAIGGLYIDVDRSQDFDPWRAFPEGGKVILRVAPGEPDDTFGEDVFATARGEYTYLRESIDCNDATIPVKDTSALASSGVVHIGVECIAYSGTTSDTLTGATRGKFSPFANGNGGRFGRAHKAGRANAFETDLEPIVSERRRGTWQGALVGVWLHKVDADGRLNSRADARCIFAGTIAEPRDDGETGHTAIECVDILDRVRTATLVRDVFRARVADGMWISAPGGGVNDPQIAGHEFNFSDSYLSTTWHDGAADPLVCVIGAPASAYEIRQGFYTIDELASAINAWLAQARADGDISGNYLLVTPYLVKFGDAGAPAGEMRTNMMWRQTNGVAGKWSLEIPGDVATFLGIDDTNPSAFHTAEWSDEVSGSNDWTHEFGKTPPMRWWIPGYLQPGYRVRLTDVEGEPWDNTSDDWMPPSIPVPKGAGTNYAQDSIDVPPLDPNLEWGVFSIGGKPFVIGSVDMTDPDEVILRSPMQFVNGNSGSTNPYHDGSTLPPRVEISQVFAIQASPALFLKSLLYSTGTSGFNSTDYDKLPTGLSIAIPGEILGAALEASLDNAPAMGDAQPFMIEKSTTIEKIMNADLVLRGVALAWKDEGLQFRSWDTPVAGNAVAHLTEDNKALPADNRGSHRTPSAQSTEWLAPIVRIEYGREWVSDSYQDSIVIQDTNTIDDLAGVAPVTTVEARNMDKAIVEAVAPLFLARMPNVSRPAYRQRRTIDQTLFEVLTPGDTVLLTDGFARDPSTGKRSTVAQPALVVGVRYSLGGRNASNPQSIEPQMGEVDLVTYPGLRAAFYSPSMSVDETFTAGLFTAGYNGTTGLKVKSHDHSEPGDNIDSSHFLAGDEIEIVEVDPVDPSAPLYWERSISGFNTDGTIVTINSALSSPAFNSARKYTIRSRKYASAEVTQQVNVYFADDTTAVVDSEAPAYHYAGAVSGVAFTAEDDSAPSELVAELSYGDGRARDVAMERTIIRTLNNIVDHKAARNSPVMLGGTTPLSGGGSAYRMIAVSDKYFGRLEPSAFVQRFCSIAPRFHSSDGSGASVWVALCRALPNGDSYDNVSFAGAADSFIWTTSSTTPADGAPHDFDLRVVPPDGVGTIVILATANARFRGLSKCRQGARVE